MALSSSSPAQPQDGESGDNYQTKQHIGKRSDFSADNNYQAVEPSAGSDNEEPNNPETTPRTSRTVDALLNTDAFVLDGEWFYDAVAVEGERRVRCKEQGRGGALLGAASGLQVDGVTRAVYYYNHSRPEGIQWLPPADLSHGAVPPLGKKAAARTLCMLIADRRMQQTQTSRWLNENASGTQQQNEDE
ncbi:unnamed protein product [Phytophthora lilii]|uniref:Unnamed protein product n=1 Tax=Phytophthora lilii TaxID=2077276 RepID=A0A9W7D9M8_9STRA|nr:unnamed protein product [Phytophthora lilii]